MLRASTSPARPWALAVAASMLFGACGNDDDAPEPAAAGTSSPYIGSLAVDPSSGTLMIGTGLGLFRYEPGETRATPAEGRLVADSATGAISANLVLSYAGARSLVASGHPEPGSELPEDLGLIRSGDGGATWTPVSLLGEADLHELDARGEHVVGQPAEEPRLLVSSDGGRSFEDRTPPDVPSDVDLDPTDPRRMAITTAGGVFVSQDRGATWRQRDTLAVEAHLAWSESGLLYRVDAGGAVKASDDGGASWTARGNAGGSPTTVTVDAEDRLYVALPGAVIKRSDDGGKTFSQILRLTA